MWRAVMLAGVVALAGCYRIERRDGVSDGPPYALPAYAQAVGVHTRDGRLYLLNEWRRSEDAFVGHGTEWSADRMVSDSGSVQVPLADVVYVEWVANVQKETAYGWAIATVLVGGVSALTALADVTR